MMIEQFPSNNNSDEIFGDSVTKKLPEETMSFTNELFERVVMAVRCSLTPNSANIERLCALKFLDDLKENHPLISLTVGFELLKQPNNSNPNVPLLHHYGLHLIESILKYKWTLLKADEKSLIREQFFLLIKNSLLSQTFMDPIYIRNTLARCLVEMIKRDCFEKTNIALDEIIFMTQNFGQIENSDRNATEIELVLLVYRFLNEDLTIYAQMIQAHRRRQLFSQLQKRLNDLLPCLIRLATELLNVQQHFERLTHTCLLAVNSFLVWVDYQHFEQYELFLCELFLKFFQLPSVTLRHASFECLLSLVNKRLARRQLQQQQQQRNKRIALLPSAALNCQQEKVFLDYLLGDATLEMFFRLLLSPTVRKQNFKVKIANQTKNNILFFRIRLNNYERSLQMII